MVNLHRNHKMYFIHWHIHIILTLIPSKIMYWSKLQLSRFDLLDKLQNRYSINHIHRRICCMEIIMIMTNIQPVILYIINLINYIKYQYKFIILKRRNLSMLNLWIIIVNSIMKIMIIIVSILDRFGVIHWRIQSNILHGLHTDIITYIAISSDGQTLITGGYDGLLRVWEIKFSKNIMKSISSSSISSITSLTSNRSDEHKQDYFAQKDHEQREITTKPRNRKSQEWIRCIGCLLIWKVSSIKE